MATHLSTRSVFCTACGNATGSEACAARCGRPFPATAAATRAVAEPRARRRWVLLVGNTMTALAVAIATALGALALDTTGELSERDDSAASSLRAAEQRVDDLADRLDASIASTEALHQQVEQLAARIRKQPKTSATVRRAATSVFTVVTDEGTGSGWVASSTGGRSEIVTNFHVVSETYVNGGRQVELERGSQSFAGRITEVAETDDLALISVDRPLPALPIAPQQPAVGDPLLVLGSPLGLGGTVTSGIVSAHRKEDGLPFLQFSAPISPGNSGGPVVDQRGRVVGVAVSKLVGGGAEGLGFAVPTSRLCLALDLCA